MEKDKKKKTSTTSSKKTSSTQKSSPKKATIKKTVAQKSVQKKDNKIKEKKNIIIEEPKEEVVKTVKESKKEDKGVKTKKNLDALDDNRKAIYSFIVGLLIGLLILVIVWPDRIAELKDGTQPVVKFGNTTITADDLYTDMKNHYSVSLLIDTIDDIILSDMFKEDNDMKDSIEETYKSYISYYEQAGYTEEQFLSGNGFTSKDDFLEVLKLDYRRNKYLDKYVEDSISDKDIDKFYKDEVFGDIDSKHILVKISDDEKDGMSDEDAKKLAEEIIEKLNDGMTFDEAKDEYEDKITYEELGYQSFNASLESAYMDAIKELENDEYSKEPVKTSYGYHIIYRIDQKKKPKLKDIKEEIIEVLSDDKKAEDSNLLYKSLISLREKKKLNFIDTDLEDKYNTYINSIE